MSAELVRRLRLGFFSDVATEIASKAADEIERLTAERDALSAQLRAAREQEPMAHIDDLGHIQFTDGGKLKRGDKLYAAPVPPSQEARDAMIEFLAAHDECSVWSGHGHTVMKFNDSRAVRVREARAKLDAILAAKEKK